ncbi:hypothetical protein D3C78_1202640 [compost metagenome]
MRQITVHKGDIFTRYTMLLQLLCKRNMGKIVFGCHQKTCRVLIYTMNNAWSYHTVNAGQILAMVHKRIDQCAGGMAWRGMNNHPPRLVYYDKIGILIQNLKRDVLRLNSCFLGFWNLQRHFI